jgi:hypothetical protein
MEDERRKRKLYLTPSVDRCDRDDNLRAAPAQHSAVIDDEALGDDASSNEVLAQSFGGLLGSDQQPFGERTAVGPEVVRGILVVPDLNVWNLRRVAHAMNLFF